MNDPSPKSQPNPRKAEPPVEGTSPQLAPPDAAGAEATGVQTSPPTTDATGVQVGGPHPSTQVRVHKDQPDIPRYRIIKRLGKGGMGVVWLANDLVANRTVALKMTISDELRDDERQRFLTEAQAMAKLRHASVVQVYDVGEYDGRPYFTMEYCPGGALNDYLDRKPQPAKVCAQILERLALGVQHAHESSIIHRDLKPANVLVGRAFEEEVDHAPTQTRSSTNTRSRQEQFHTALRSPNAELLKITDFGLAKNLEGSAQVTGSQDVMGTPSYMAPEQGTSTKKADARADIWSLGVILYEAITGQLPFVGADRFETYLNACEKDPVPPGDRVKCPRDLETICLKCLRKDAKDRYQSAQALADDLRAFLDEQSISARPMSRVEKSVKWVKKNPGVSLLLALFVTTLVSATLVSLSYAGQSARDADEAKRERKKAVDALADAREQTKRRALSQVKTLLTADPRAVPSVLETLVEDRDDVLPRLNEVWDKATAEKDRLRAGLALLPVDADKVRSVLTDGMLKVSDPTELVVIRDALRPYVKDASPLWQKLDADPKRRLPLLACLAAFDEKNPKWQTVGDSILQPWLSDNPLYLGDWTDALRPVRLSLIPSLKKVYSGELLPELKYVAANILGDYASDRPEVLVGLVQSGDDRQFNTLFPVLEKHRAKAIELFRAALKQQPEAKWDDAPLDPKWVAPSMETLAEIEKAQGMIAERFAFLQSLPLSRLEPLAEALAKAGYRPRRVRPFRQGEEWKTTVVWLRDGKGFRLKSGLTEEAAKGENARQAKEQFLPLDAAAYRDGGTFRFVVLWERVEQAERRELLLTVPNNGYGPRWQKFRDDKLTPLGKQVLGIGANEWRITEVWSASGPAFNWNFGVPKAELAYLLGDPAKVPGDLGYSPRLEPERVAVGEAMISFAPPWATVAFRALGANLQKSQYSLLHQARPAETEVLVGLDAAKHGERCRELAAQGYRPSSVATDGAECASVWERPVVRDEQREAVAKTVSGSGMGLTRLGDDEPVWPVLQFSPQPEARTRSVLRFAETGTPVGLLIDRLKVEKDNGVRQGLILALGHYAESQVTKDQKREVIDLLLKWYRDDPDSGIHAAIDWLLRPTKDGPHPRRLAWGQAEALKEIDAALAGKVGAGKDRNWYVNGQGQTYAVLDSREPLLMSSPSWEKDRFDGNEYQHWRKLDRKYAVATKPVTAGQFERFKKANPEISHANVQKYAPDSDCPAIAVTWYEAIAYCRWLSEEEGLGESEMVYPKVSEIVKAAKDNNPLTMPKDYLRRTGYRLMSEAEWEYAARSGTMSPYYYGSSVELLRDHGWYTKNTNDEQSYPVGQKPPNAWGLFDMSGNVWCWTQSRFAGYPKGTRGTPALDVEENQRISDKESRVLRGGSFDGQASFLRSSLRYPNRPSDRYNSNGFRPSRTFD